MSNSFLVILCCRHRFNKFILHSLPTVLAPLLHATFTLSINSSIVSFFAARISNVKYAFSRIILLAVPPSGILVAFTDNYSTGFPQIELIPRRARAALSIAFALNVVLLHVLTYHKSSLSS